MMGMPAPASAPDSCQTRDSLAADMRALGVRSGQALLVHASMRSLGTVRGGAAEVVAALRDAVGPEGTLAVPTGTAGNSDTSRLYLNRTAGLTAEQISRYKAAMPPFDPATTPSDGMGEIAEQVRTTPGAVRSAHPQSSFAALGPMASKLADGHALDCHHGESSPLARLYRRRLRPCRARAAGPGRPGRVPSGADGTGGGLRGGMASPAPGHCRSLTRQPSQQPCCQGGPAISSSCQRTGDARALDRLPVPLYHHQACSTS